MPMARARVLSMLVLCPGELRHCWNVAAALALPAAMFSATP
ncbi:MAG: hypothetical protein U0325_14895 [Polyangiales bacterium]